MTLVPAPEQSWLKVFFGEGNALKWEDLIARRVRPHWAQYVLPWLKFVGEAPNPKPLVLPIFDDRGPAHWYGLAEGTNGLVQLAEEIRAFVGPGLSDFTGRPVFLSDLNPIEAALKDRFGLLALKFAALPSVSEGALEQQLVLYAKALARRPRASERGQRPFGTIRADFDSAVLAGNADRAYTLIEELASTGRLTAEQRRSVEIRRLAGIGRFEELARDDLLLRAVMDLSLPAQTLLDLISALFKTYMAPVIKSGATLQESLDAFRNRIGDRYGPLFRERKGIRDSEVLRSFLLFEATSASPDIGRCKAILATYPEVAEGRSWAEQLVTELIAKSGLATKDGVAPSSHSPEMLAKLAIGDEDYARAVDLCIPLLPRLIAYQIVLRCGVDSQDQELARRVEAIVDETPSSVLNNFDERDRRRLEQLQLLSRPNQKPSPRRDWVAWAQWVQHEKPALSKAQEVLKASVASWDPGEYALNPETCDEFAMLIGNATRDVEEIFRTAFPDIVEFFVERSARPVKAFASIYAILVKVLAWSGTTTSDESQILVSVLQALFETAPSGTTYVEALGDVNEIVRANHSPNRIDWELDLCELLAAYPSPDHEASLRIFVDVANYLRTTAHRLSKGQRFIFKQLAKDYQCPEIVATVPESSDDNSGAIERAASDYAGQIAIYTLAERSAANAKAALELQLPNAKIVLNADLVCTEPLRSLARNSDVFVFSWKKATHAAFHCVRDVRGLENVVQPTGGGAASIINAVVDALSAETMAR